MTFAAKWKESIACEHESQNDATVEEAQFVGLECDSAIFDLFQGKSEALDQPEKWQGRCQRIILLFPSLFSP